MKTSVEVIDRLEQAAATLKRMPKVRLPECSGFWPEIIREFIEAYGYNDADVRLGPPSAEHISEMDEALTWILWLDKDEAKLVWMRANGIRWKSIVRRLGKCIKTQQTNYRVAIVKIVSILNSQKPPEELPYKTLLAG